MVLHAENNWGLPRPFSYSRGYLILPHPVEGLPQSIDLAGGSMQAKQQFHVSLICVKKLVTRLVDERKYSASDAEELLLGYLGALLRAHALRVATYGEFRIATRDLARTLVLMCSVDGLHTLADELATALRLEFPYPPTHVTLFTRAPGEAIGITDQAELDELTRCIDSEEFAALAAQIDQAQLMNAVVAPD